MMIIEIGNTKIKFIDGIIDKLLQFSKKNDNFLESGGVIIGKENDSNSNIIITNITVPYENDIRKYDRFIRKDKKHIEIFNDLYNNHNKIHRYIGEWHTHDEKKPNHSKMDFDNWISISDLGPLNETYFHIILGHDYFNVYEFSQNAIKNVRIIDILNFEGENNEKYKE